MAEVDRDAGLTPEQCRPARLDLSLSAQCLTIAWTDGVTVHYPVRLLRAHCPCATCRSDRHNAPKAVLPILSPTQAKAADARAVGGTTVGNYALQLVWSDGHATGIYDYRLLRSLAAVIGEVEPEGGE